MFTQHRRLEQFRRVAFHIAIHHHKPIERTHATQYATLRPRPNADVVESGGKLLKVTQFHLFRMFFLMTEEHQQLIQVAGIGIQRIGRNAALQFQVSQVVLFNFVLQILACFHLFLYFCRGKDTKKSDK